MNGKKIQIRQLVTDELVEFEKSPVEVGDCRRITYHCSRGIYRRIYPNLMKENRRMSSTCNRLDFANTRMSIDYFQKSP
jgi:hypothetical protein